MTNKIPVFKMLMLIFHPEGYISFDQNGRRTNFSLDVMEMNPRSELLQIGKWSDQVNSWASYIFIYKNALTCFEVLWPK
jgi:hypothetical protein